MTETWKIFKVISFKVNTIAPVVMKNKKSLENV